MTHYYEIEGKRMPSVTQIISDCTNKGDALTQWSANQVVEWIRANRKAIKPFAVSKDRYVLYEEDFDPARFAYKTTSQTALDVGSEVHKAIEAFLTNILNGVNNPIKILDTLDGQTKHAFAAFYNWYGDHDLKPIALEQTVYGNGWAGTLDFFGYFDGKLYVIDWKSSKAHYKEMDYQVAAYRSAVESNAYCDPQINITGCGVLRLDKTTGLPEWKDTSKSYESDLAIFQAMVNLYMLRHPRISRGARWSKH